MRSAAEQDALARQIVDASVAIHCKFGPGCFESAYTPCLAHELARRHVHFETAVWMDLVYEDLIVPRAYQIDMIVEDALLIEVKAVEEISRVHGRQVLTYLRLTGFGLGLLLNFGAATMPQGIRRIVNNFPYGTTPIGRRTQSHAETP